MAMPFPEIASSLRRQGNVSQQADRAMFALDGGVDR